MIGEVSSEDHKAKSKRRRRKMWRGGPNDARIQVEVFDLGSLRLMRFAFKYLYCKGTVASIDCNVVNNTAHFCDSIGYTRPLANKEVS
jgi:hypothetical protein